MENQNTNTPYPIDTGFIYEKLINEYKGKFPETTMQEIIYAMENTIPYYEGHTFMEKDYYDTKEKFMKTHPQYKYSFPDYFCSIFNGTSEDGMAVYPPILYVYSYSQSCIIAKGQDFFNFFFALQFSMLESEIKNDFLKYQFIYNFDEKSDVFTLFLKKICYDYFYLINEEDKQVLNNFASTITVSTTATKDSVKEFTTSRQVLAVHYIFEYMKVTGIDQSQKARFIHFLTGKSEKNIYDLIRNPLSTKNKNFRKEDLQFIRQYFENLGLTEIVKMINNELEK